VYPDGRRAALEESTVGEHHELGLAPLRHQPELLWPAPARWWWQVTVHELGCLARVREIFPMTARTCEAHGATSPSELPAMLVAAMPDLHWLTHTGSAKLLGHPHVLDHPATVSLGPGRPAQRDMTSVVPALSEWLTGWYATRALRRLDRRRTAERQLFLAVGYTGLPLEAFDALVRAGGVPAAPPAAGTGLSHLWVAPVLGRALFLWSRQGGWSRHEPWAELAVEPGPRSATVGGKTRTVRSARRPFH
jgi:hypothetical protein